MHISKELAKRIIVSLLFLLMFGVSLAGHKYNTSYLISDWALADVGQTYMSALHLLEGQVPYRDFQYQWGPYALYLTAYVLKLFGIKISSIKLVMTLTVIAITGITYLLGREFLPRFHAFFAALIIHIIFIQNTLVPYANIFVIPVGLTALLLVVKYRRTRQEYAVLLAGFLCGIALGLKFNAGFLVCAGIVMGLIAVDEQHEQPVVKPAWKATALIVRTIIPVVLILGMIALISKHLSMKYFLLFILPALIACFAAWRPKGRSHQIAETSEKGTPFLAGSLLLLGLGILAGSAPWLGFYLIKLDASKMLHYLIAAPLAYSRHIFHPYYEMERTAAYFFGYTLICALLLWLIHKASFQKYAWIAASGIIGGYVWIFHSLEVSTFGKIVSNITFFLAPITSIAAGLFVLAGKKLKPEENVSLEEDAGITAILAYHVFFFFVAYPHTEATHLSWSYPTFVILLFYLLAKVQDYVVNIWPERTKKSAGRIVAMTLAFFLPVLISANQILWIFCYFYDVAPDLSTWSKREYVKLRNKRARIYEFLGSAYQIEHIDSVINLSTGENAYIFEFPTTFFYFYSQRTNPTKWDYFYPGLVSDKQYEIINDLEEKKPKITVIYDNPDAYLFSYSKAEIRDNYKEIIAYIDTHYRKYQEIGHFKILERICRAGGAPITGDWNGDGVDEIGMFKDGVWLLDLSADPTRENAEYRAEGGCSTPLVGDWNGDGTDEIGVFKNSMWSLDLDGNRMQDDEMQGFGWGGDTPVVGDWNGDGADEIGVFRNGTWLLDFNGDFIGDDESRDFGTVEDTPICGDWNGDGVDEIGVFRNGTWLLDFNGNFIGDDELRHFGEADDIPVTGDWNGDGADEIGVFRNGTWLLDMNGNFVRDDASYSFEVAGGKSADMP